MLEVANIKNILLVSGSMALIEEWKNSLRYKHYRIYYAQFIEEAEEALELSRPSLVVLDAALPGAYEFCGKHNGGQTRPILVMGERRGRKTKPYWMSCGSCDFIPLPFSHRQFAKKVKEITGEKVVDFIPNKLH